jgi:hypothetical protein
MPKPFLFFSPLLILNVIPSVVLRHQLCALVSIEFLNSNEAAFCHLSNYWRCPRGSSRRKEGARDTEAGNKP